eukprot:sb/3478026/
MNFVLKNYFFAVAMLVTKVLRLVAMVTKAVAMGTKPASMETLVQVGYQVYFNFKFNRISTRVTSVTVVPLGDVLPLHGMAVGHPKRCPLRTDGRTLLVNYTIC